MEFFGKTKSLDALEEQREKMGKRKIGGGRRRRGGKKKKQKVAEAAAEAASTTDVEGKTVFDFLNKIGKPEPAPTTTRASASSSSTAPAKSLNVQLVEIQRDLGVIKREYTSLTQTWNVCLAKDSLVAKECQRRMEELKARGGELTQKEKLIKQRLSGQKDQRGLLKF